MPVVKFCSGRTAAHPADVSSSAGWSRATAQDLFGLRPRCGRGFFAWAGDGAGGLGAPASFNVGPGLRGLVAADFNGDGNLDLAVAVSGQNAVCLLRGDGAGNLQTPLCYAVGTQPVALAVGDIDGDGKPDLAVANRQSRDFSILLNQN